MFETSLTLSLVVELGISGGLAGVARFAGGAVAISGEDMITILTRCTTWLTKGSCHSVPDDAYERTALESCRACSPRRDCCRACGGCGACICCRFATRRNRPCEVPRVTAEIIAAGGAAFQQAYAVGLRIIALSSLNFGALAIIACCFCNDIGPKMNNKIEVFLENDEHAEKNKYL
jgi:hypothetical protein